MTLFPYRKIAYNSDHTEVFMVRGDLKEDVHPEGVDALNGFYGSTSILEDSCDSLLFLFPTPMRIRGIFQAIRDGWWIKKSTYPYMFQERIARVSVSYSTDAVGIDDGDWKSPEILPFVPNEDWSLHLQPQSWGTFMTPLSRVMWPGESYPPPRRIVYCQYSNIHLSNDVWVDSMGGVYPMELRNVRALKINIVDFPQPPNSDIASASNATQAYLASNVSLFGEPELGAWRNYLQIQDGDHQDSTLSSSLDWGGVAWGSSADRGIRIKNLSASGTATDVQVFVADPSWVDPLYDMFLFSLDGISWNKSVSIATLTPGATSPLIYVRRVTLEDDPIGDGQVLLKTKVGMWV